LNARARLAAFLLVLATAPAAATTVEVDSLGEVPAEYQGRWDSGPRACVSPAGSSRLQISARRLVFGADRFEAVDIALAEDGIFVASRYHGGAKSAWERWDRLALSEDGATLTDRHDGGRTIVRRRCRP